MTVRRRDLPLAERLKVIAVCVFFSIKQMRLTLLLLLLLIPPFPIASAVPDLEFRFVEDYFSEEFFRTPVYNVIDCRKPNEIKWPRFISLMFRGLLSIHRTVEPLSAWVDTSAIQTFFLNLECPNVPVLLRQANALNLFRKPFRWLLLDTEMFDLDRKHDNSTGNELESKWYWRELRDLDVLLDAEVRMIYRAPAGRITEIVSCYKTRKNGDLMLEKMGEWTPGKGIVLRNRDCSAIRRWNVRQAPLTGSFVVTHPDTLNHLEDMVDKHIDPISKVGYVSTKNAVDMINASLEMKIVNTWGVSVNGTWTGMVGDLQSGVVEIGISPAFVLADRMSVLHYYELITPSKSKFIFLSPPLSFSNNIFAMPFGKTVWYCCLIMISVSSVFLYVAVNMRVKASGLPAEKGEGRFTLGTEENFKEMKKGANDSFSDVLMLNVGAVCMQGIDVQFKGASSRIIIIFLYLSYMFLYVSYSGSIVALLQSSDTSIRTFKDLLESPLQAGADDVVYSQYYFKTGSDPIRRALYEKKIAPKGEAPHFLPPEEGVKNIRKGLYAFHVETSVGYSLIQQTFTEDEKCNLQEFELSFIQNVDPLLAMRQHSPFAELLKIGLKKVIERGLNHRVFTRIYTKKPACSSKSSQFVSVGLVDCYHAFVILGYGTVFAWCIFLGEKLLVDKNIVRLRKRFRKK